MKARITYHDHKPVEVNLQDAVVAGLSRKNKSLPPKFFYDERGSALFDLICEQPEYYLPAVERRMLVGRAEEIAALVGKGRVLIEPGAGSLAKVRLLLDALRPSAFVPMDISFNHLSSAAQELADEFPWLPVHAVCVDFTHSLPVPEKISSDRRMVFFPGSSLGNFGPEEVAEFLHMVHGALGETGVLLIGVDTKKKESVLNAAYNDRAHVTEAFNRNLLVRMRRELNMEINPDVFEHSAFYNAAEGRIEMHLISKRRQTLRLNGHRFDFQAGESLHTENSYKYAPLEFLALAANNGFAEIRHWVDDDGLFAIYLLETR